MEVPVDENGNEIKDGHGKTNAGSSGSFTVGLAC